VPNEKMVTLLEDTALVAFLAYCGHKVVPIRSKEPTPEEPHVRIAFEVHGELDDDVEAFYANAKVGIADYVKHLKSVRGSMFNLKKLQTKREVLI